MGTFQAPTLYDRASGRPVAGVAVTVTSWPDGDPVTTDPAVIGTDRYGRPRTFTVDGVDFVQVAAGSAEPQVVESLEHRASGGGGGGGGGSGVELGSRWVALGDSLTAVEGGAPDGNGWVDMLRFRSEGRFYLVHNAGVFGNNSGQMLARLDTDVLAHEPQVVTVLAGANDVTQDVPLATYAANMTAIVDQIVAAGATVVLLTVPPRDLPDKKLAGTATVNLWLREFARDRNVPIVDIHPLLTDPATGGYAAGMGHTDGLHLSRSGAMTIAEAVIAALLDRMPLASVPAPSSNVDPSNLLANALLLDGPSSAPTSWYTTAAPAGVTQERVATPDFRGGYAWQIEVDAPGADVSTQIYANADTGWAVGDRLLFVARFEIEGTPDLPDTPPGSQFGMSFQGLFYGAPADAVQRVALYQNMDGHHGLFYGVLTVPPGTTGPVQFVVAVGMPAGSSGTFRAGEFGLFNLTSLDS